MFHCLSVPFEIFIHNITKSSLYPINKLALYLLEIICSDLKRVSAVVFLASCVRLVFMHSSITQTWVFLLLCIFQINKLRNLLLNIWNKLHQLQCTLFTQECNSSDLKTFLQTTRQEKLSILFPILDSVVFLRLYNLNFPKSSFYF